jgi:hypothetical protein
MTTEYGSDITKSVEEVVGPFLEERLQQLGLDYETYGSYLIPLLSTDKNDNNNDDGDDDNEEEWDSVLNLLQASSESHSDDDIVWKELRTKLESIWSDYLKEHRRILEEKQNELKLQYKNEIANAILQAEQAAEQQQQHAEEIIQETKSSAAKDEATKALLDRYGYEVDDDDDEANGEAKAPAKGGATATTDSETPISNREYMQQKEKERIQELRSKKGIGSKKVEQQKTNEAKKTKRTT